ncbi:MAG: tocopherol cyclase family protein [Pseudomonadota bacterium]
MKMIFIIISISVFFITNSLLANGDPYNSYRWNRQNYLQGNGKIDRRPWYEWWYYKVVLPQNGESFYFVYGVVNPWDTQGILAGTRSYVGMGDFAQKNTFEEKFPLNSFTADYKDTHVDIAGNEATAQSLVGAIKDQQGRSYSWNIQIAKKWTYNPLGWALGQMIPNIEWYTAAADARCSGWIDSDGKHLQFSDAPCYQDRNWGYSFPPWWSWIVSNQFKENPDSVLAVGGGQPIIQGTTLIKGVSVGFKHKGKEYAFRPNYLDKVSMDINWGKWEIDAQKWDQSYRIKISAWAPKEKFLDLKFMTPEGKVYHDYETLTGQVSVWLYRNAGRAAAPSWKLMDTLTSDYAGIEYGSENVYELQKLFSGRNKIY